MDHSAVIFAGDSWVAAHLPTPTPTHTHAVKLPLPPHPFTFLSIFVIFKLTFSAFPTTYCSLFHPPLFSCCHAILSKTNLPLFLFIILIYLLFQPIHFSLTHSLPNLSYSLPSTIYPLLHHSPFLLPCFLSSSTTISVVPSFTHILKLGSDQ